MKNKLRSILLVDDNSIDNFVHKRAIIKFNLSTIIIAKDSALDALEYLKSCENIEDMQPDLIFLDINMPCMNGWEFLQEFELLDKKLQSNVKIIMLSTSDNADDIARAKNMSMVSDYMTKPLTIVNLKEIENRYFANYSVENTAEKVLV